MHVPSVPRRLVLRLLLVPVVGLPVACAVRSPEVFHSVTVANFTASPVRQLKLTYGNTTIEFPGRIVYRGMASEAGEMNVPSEVIVEWLDASAAKQVERIPIHLQAIHPRSLSNLTIRFTDAGIELYQGVRVDKHAVEYQRIHPR